MLYETGNATLAMISDAGFRYQVEQANRISLPNFEKTIAVFTALALACFIARLSIRLIYLRRLDIDDLFLILATACFCAATAVLYQNCFLFFLNSAIFQSQELIFTRAFPPYITKLYNSTRPRNTFAALNWTAIYAVKFCFFTFFKPLIRHLCGLTRFYWISVTFTLLAWIVSVYEGFSFNRYTQQTISFDMASQKWYQQALAFGISLTIANIVSDIMLVSIPILLLRNSMMRPTTKWSIASFLCLSIFMVLCSIVRIAGWIPMDSHIPDLIWRFFWQQIEACIAITTASITVFRTIFIHHNRRNPRPICRNPMGINRIPYSSYTQQNSIRGPHTVLPGHSGQEIVPSLPPATYSGVPTYISKTSREKP
ncbi:hypothetical protein CC78DRAFT_316935 [Lojkania enalia]|uniref:Rhodopsin domain-containing protein n=1 Tax=Lojkania enalia TaxID=147567 RepID=A0A9P4K6Y9_9PLEO|nr:hypothetical protein CC78DRAFT_316935 [Didymosphaeria enalia]